MKVALIGLTVLIAGGAAGIIASVCRALRAYARAVSL